MRIVNSLMKKPKGGEPVMAKKPAIHKMPVIGSNFLHYCGTMNP